MTLLLILGIAAGLYLVWLVFTLAIYALPLYAGMAAGLWAHSTGSGVLAALGIGLAAAITTLLVGQFLFQMVRSPILRATIALAFAVPAGVAGYSAVEGIASLGLHADSWGHALAWTGAIIIGTAAWSRIARSGAACPTTALKSLPGAVQAGK